VARVVVGVGSQLSRCHATSETLRIAQMQYLYQLVVI
jgi:hypothetical protein